MQCFQPSPKFNDVLGVKLGNELTAEVQKYLDGNRLKETCFYGYLNDVGFYRFAGIDENNDDKFKGVDVKKLAKKLNDYYNQKVRDIRNTSERRQQKELFGFSSIQFKYDAIEHTGNVISDIYDENRLKDKNDRLVGPEVILEAINRIRDNFDTLIASPFINNAIINGNEKAIAFKKILDKYDEIYKTIETQDAQNLVNIEARKKNIDIIKKYHALINQKNAESRTKLINFITKNFNKTFDAKDAKGIHKFLTDKKEEINNEIKLLKKPTTITIKDIENENGEDITYTKTEINRRKTLSKRLFIEENSTNEVELNWANLVNQTLINKEEWFNRVFASSQFTNLAKEFEEAIEEVAKVEDINKDDGDVGVSVDDSVDEMAKNWSDKIYTDFKKYIGGRTKYYLSRLYKLNDYAVDNNLLNYNTTDSSMRTRTVMGANYLISQIMRYADFHTLDDFITSLERRARNIPELYGLSVMINDMKADPIFAHQIYFDLNNPIITKTQSIVNENGETIVDRFNYADTNQNTDARVKLINDMLNVIKSTDDFVINEDFMKEIVNMKSVDEIADVFCTLFPIINRDAIRNYLTSTATQDNNPIQSLPLQINGLIGEIMDYKDQEARVDAKYNEAFAKYKNLNNPFAEKPKKDYSSISYNGVNNIIVNLANNLLPFVNVKTNFNSSNAEGNQASDMVNHSYLTNLMSQCSYGIDLNPDDKDYQRGLKNLLEFVNKNGIQGQLAYNNILFGLRDKNNKLIMNGSKPVMPGIFEFENESGTKAKISPYAEQIIKYKLFDGAKIKNSKNGTMYDGMSKNDYFITQMIAFNSAQNTNDALSREYAELVAEYFLRTPSDAPKNYTFRNVRISIDNLFMINDISYDKNVNNYIDVALNELLSTYDNVDIANSDDADSVLAKLLNEDPTDNYHKVENYYNNNPKAAEKNIITPKDFIDILHGDVNLNGKERNRDGYYYLTVPSKTTKRARDKVYLKVKEIRKNNSFNKNDIEYSIDYIRIDDMDILTRDNDVREYFAAQYNLNATYDINREHPLVQAFKQQLVGELNNFVENLNNISDVNGEYLTNTKHLFERAHYNGDIFDAKTGRLSGNFFKFKKLFNSSGYNVNEEMIKALSLYGQGGLINSKKVNKSKNISWISKSNDKKVHLKMTEELNTILEDIAYNWTKAFNEEITKNIKEDYYNIINDTHFNYNQVREFFFNSALMNMNFDDIVEGNVNYYKGARDFLKRAKEGQAGGKVYANNGIYHSIGGPIVAEKRNGQELTVDINVNGSPYLTPRKEIVNGKLQFVNKPITIEDGFRAVTIYNTVRYLDETADKINRQLREYYAEQNGGTLTEEAANLALTIAQGFGSKTLGGFKTKTNDAQSYITVEEFIRRHHLAGDLHDYDSVLSKLVDPNAKFTASEVVKLNKKVQVQKNYYYDMQYDPDTQCYYPRQIKNAEFVLIPALIKGTDLEKLYNIMKRNNIGQVNTAETSKAAKKNVFTFWDNNGNVNENFEKDINGVGENFNPNDLSNYNDSPIENYYYRYLYRQQEVPQHMQDARNKAGIQIMKKVLDNVSPENEEIVKDFFKWYGININNSATMLKRRMKWTDEDINNPDAKLDFTELIKQAKREAQRLDMDSNFIDYLDGIMPNYMNTSASKLESIFQAIFNSAVTRQTMPGWHAAQVTGVGHGVKIKGSNGQFRQLEYHPEAYRVKVGDDYKYISSRDYERLTDEEKKLYEKADAPYVEIMIPRWSKNIKIGDEFATLKELEDAGLDLHIGYRIPTEGKQSVCVMKVVGFLDDIYGSTIMLPDEWVQQTGADFDVDSVYGICYEFFKAHGKYVKYEIDRGTSEQDVRKRYKTYVLDATREYMSNLTDTESERATIKELYDKYHENKRNELHGAIAEIYDRSKKIFGTSKNSRLPADFRKAIMDYNNGDGKTLDEIDKHNGQLIVIRDYLNQKRIENDMPSQAELNAIEEFKSVTQEITEIDAVKEGIISAATAQLDEAAKAELIKQEEEHIKTIENLAKEQGLESLKEFSARPIEQQQCRQAVNNAILDCMIKIMSSKSSMEENYGRSHFEDLTKAMDKWNNLRGYKASEESAYNPFVQLNYMENAMGGATLKAFSVTRDTFVSVNNYAHGRLTEGHNINVVYDLTNGQYSTRTLYNAYKEDITLYDDGGNEIEIEDNDKNLESKLKSATKAVINHNKFAWSLTNRNVVGKLITSYSSQTTAHILDAIKEGSIFNENKYTFGTFKTLVDIGMDYDTAIGFLMQPGITTINKNYSRSESIYVIDNVNIIGQSIVDTINDYLGTNYDYKDEALNALLKDEKFVKKYKEIWFNAKDVVKVKDGIFKPDIAKRMILDKSILEKRFDKKIDNITKSVIDLGIIMQFNKIHGTTENIEKLARLSNPDRFGAKQTIHATRQKYKSIMKYIESEDNRVANTLKIGNHKFIDKLYPKLSGINEESAYPYLQDFLMNATIPSIRVNEKYFITENDDFDVLIDDIEKRLGKTLTDDEYKEYKQYLVSYVYNQIPQLVYPVTLDENNALAMADYIDENGMIKRRERDRIFGFKEPDINSLNLNDIDDFAKLTPAQKVNYIKTTFTEYPRIFDKLFVNKFNQTARNRDGYSANNITFNDEVENIEEMFKEFEEAFYNTNPHVRLTAIDLIKFAFIANGFNFRKGAVAKFITNNTLYSDISDGGMDIISPIKEAMNQVITSLRAGKNNPNAKIIDEFVEMYIRSHDEYFRTINFPKSFKGNYLRTKSGIVIIPLTLITNEENSSKNKLITKLGLSPTGISDQIGYNTPGAGVKYVKCKIPTGNNQSTISLYKAVYNNGLVILQPLNRLEKNEISEFSSLDANNTTYSTKGTNLLVKCLIEMDIDNIQGGISISNDLDSYVTNYTGDYTTFVIPDSKTDKHKITYPLNHLEDFASTNKIEMDKINGVSNVTFISRVKSFLDDYVHRFDNLEQIVNDNEFVVDNFSRVRYIRNSSRELQQMTANDSVMQVVHFDNVPYTIMITKTKLNNLVNAAMRAKLVKGPKRAAIIRNIHDKFDNKFTSELVSDILEYPDTRANGDFYKVTIVEKVTDNNQLPVEEEQGGGSLSLDDIMNGGGEEDFMSTTGTVEEYITESNIDRESKKLTNAENVALEIIKDITNRRRRKGDTTTLSFSKAMRKLGVRVNSNESIKENAEDIFKFASSYYLKKANSLTSLMEHFTIGDEEFRLNDPALYDKLLENPEAYNDLVTLILEAKSFGSRFYDILNLDVISTNDDTNRAIKELQASINKVRQNAVLKDAIDLLFNRYIATKYSTNPMIQNGLLKLTDNFGDADWFDGRFADVGHLSNKQVQAMLKQVYGIINETLRIEIPQAQRDFERRYEEIMNESGSFDMSKIIDEQGKRLNPYNDQFILDKQKYLAELRELREKPEGIYSIEYMKKKLEYDDWRNRNMNQPLAKDYYTRKNDYLRHILYHTNDYTVQKFIKYNKIKDEIAKYNKNLANLTAEEKVELNKLLAAKRLLLATTTADLEEKSFGELEAIKNIKAYYENIINLDKEYYERVDTEDFKTNLAYYNRIIEEYDSNPANAKETLTTKLLNDNYRQAYLWRKANARYVLDEESQKKLSELFSLLKSPDASADKKNALKGIILNMFHRGINPYNDNGELNGSLFNDAQRDAIKRAMMDNYRVSYDNPMGDAMLIKDIPSNRPVYSKAYYDYIHKNEPFERAVSSGERLGIISEINQILTKAINPVTERIDVSRFFNNTIISDTERTHLVELYDKLSACSASGKMNKAAARRYYNIMELKYNEAAYEEGKAWVLTNLDQNGYDYYIWSQIFSSIDEETGEEVPNANIYGYYDLINPNAHITIDGVQYDFVDKKRTEARNIMENEIEFITTSEYEEEKIKAIAENKYQEWFDANHVYNPYTHKFEPLKIWTTAHIKEGSTHFPGKYEWEGTYSNKETNIKAGKENPLYSSGTANYDTVNGSYNTYQNLTDKEQKMLNLFNEVLGTYANTYKAKKFINQGYMPRRALHQINGKWVAKQALGTVGLDWNTPVDQKWNEIIDYAHDFDPDFPMLELLKQKGTQSYIPYAPKGTMTDEEYKEYKKKIDEENATIRAENLKLDNDILDNNWKDVMLDFIAKAAEFNAKQRIKNSMYLMIEDLKDRETPVISNYSGELVKDNSISTKDQTQYKTSAQSTTHDVFVNFTRRLVDGQFKQASKKRAAADLLQHLASAKFMILNVTGGVANVTTGLTNILGEAAAREFFDEKTLAKAQQEWTANTLAFTRDMYSRTSDNKLVAITKLFDVVDYDDFTERHTDEDIHTYVNRLRNALYSPQTVGEHYMQNLALVAMLKSHKIYEKNGVVKVGSFQNYTNDIEDTALIAAIGEDELLQKAFKNYLAIENPNDHNTNIDRKYKYDKGKRNLIQDFIKYIAHDDLEKGKKLTEDFVRIRKKLRKNAREEFEKFDNLEDQFELVDGYAAIKKDSKLTKELFGQFTTKVIYANKKIHGVYDKLGAAQIEKYYWGSLVMQYHKHLYPGIMKRWRVNGYYNELTESYEKGSYISLGQFIATEFKDFNKNIHQDDGNVAINSVKEICRALVDTVLNAQLNWDTLSLNEQANIRRACADLSLALSSIGTALMLYMCTNDDEIKDSEALSTLVYLCDRTFSETWLYTPFGLVTESKTLYSSPIAGATGPSDMIVVAQHLTNYLFDEDYNPTYSTGLYKGENKMWVRLRRNIPAYRHWVRMNNMTKNNQYHKVDESNWNMKAARSLANKINPDD